ncbi:MAG: hypothetical protein ACPHK8_00310 [Thermoplasmatota archaeon]
MIRFVPILLCLFLITPAMAWPMTDPAGDTMSPAGAVPANGSGSDLLGMRIEETEDSLTFFVETEAWRMAAVALVDGVEITIPFQFGESSYAIEFLIYSSLDSPLDRGYRARLLADFDEGFGRHFQSLPSDWDGKELSTTIEKRAIRDHNGAPLTAGRSLTGIYAYSMQGHIGTIMDSQYYGTGDRMPDMDGLDFPLTVGAVQSDALQLVSFQPLRWSNGGATAFAYDVRVISLENQTISFEAQQVPPGWTVHVPRPVATVDDTVTVFVEVPDRHLHDGEELFNLVATAGDLTATLPLGVYYPAIPMPAGHHATLYLHGRPYVPDDAVQTLFATSFGLTGQDFGTTYMNTDASFAEDGPVPADYQLGGPDFGRWVWPILLEPFLRTGLNFTDGEAPVTITTSSPQVAQTGILSGELLFLAPEEGYAIYQDRAIEGHVLATFSEPHSLGESLQTEWTNWNLTDTSYRPGVQLAMNLFFKPEPPADQDFLTTPVQGPWTPKLQGGEFTLPLGEYHDAVTIPLTEEQEEELATLSQPEPEVQETPALSLLLCLAIVAFAASFRRR